MALRMARQKQPTKATPDDSVPVSIRFPRAKLKQIQRMAESGGESASNWIRRHAIAALNQQQAAA